jgi:hypothetical protein
MLKRVVVLVLFAALAPIAAQERAPHGDSIRKEDLRADLFFLAGDSMRGRLTDTAENRAAADFIASRFERLGLKGAGAGGSFYQPYNLMKASLGEGNQLDIVTPDGATRHLRSGQEFYPHRVSASGRVSAPVVFAGFGIEEPRFSYTDYGADVKGKIVLALDHEPGERDSAGVFEGLITAEASSAWRKALAAQSHGAVAILFVSDVHNHPGPSNFEGSARNYWPDQPPRIASYTLASWADRIRIPVLQISPALAASIVAGTGKSLEALSKSAETARGLAPLPLPGITIDVRTAVNRHIVPDRNVVALIEGSDAQLKHEWVIICAHFDHNGADSTQIFNGADDNGSGTAAMIDIAEAYSLAAKDGRGPKRSVLFAGWNSEERGLLGAWAYTEQPLAPLANVVAVLNMDMIGRNEEVPVGGGGRFNGLDVQTAESNDNAIKVGGLRWAPDLRASLEAANKGIGLQLKPGYDNNSSQLSRRSDQWPFINVGVPALGFFTGLHPDYHTSTDRPEKINYVKLEKVARLVHQMSWDLANSASRPSRTRTSQ